MAAAQDELCGPDGKGCPELPAFNGEDYFDDKPVGWLPPDAPPTAREGVLHSPPDGHPDACCFAPRQMVAKLLARAAKGERGLVT